MSSDNLSQIQVLLIALAEYYQKPLTENQLVMYAEDLSRFESEKVQAAMYTYRNNPKNKFFPIPAQLIEVLEPEIDPSLQAIEISARIWQAIANFGWPNPEGAKDFIGEIGWHVVTRMGGWPSLCDQVMQSDGGMLRAQMREMAKATMERQKLGMLFETPSFPKISVNDNQVMISDITAGMTGHLLESAKK